MIDTIKNIIIGVPIGVIYFILSSMIGEVIYKDIKIDDRQIYISIIMFISALIGLFISYYVLNKNKKYHNDSLKYGLIMGSIVLLFYTLVRNWDITSNEYKLGVFSIIFLIMLWITFKIK